MADLSKLEAAVVGLETVAPKVIAALQAVPPNQQAEIDALADRVEGQNAALNAALPVV